MRRSVVRLVEGVLAIALILTVGVTRADAATATDPAGVGNDVSWPQCGKALPTGQAFGIVGVNGGLANNTNPCLSTQLAWAAKSSGTTRQAKTALYVNTANPGLTGSWWPSSNSYPAGTPVANPYGTCGGQDSPACAYMYGYAKAYDDVNARGIATGTASKYLWWLDVETTNSWESNTVANAADLEGMTAYFQNVGARVGIYSTAYQWHVIAGTISTSSNLHGLDNWVPGARTLKAAQSNCSKTPFTSGSRVTLSQYLSGSLDYDWSC
jgi:hypothetical protein